MLTVTRQNVHCIFFLLKSKGIMSLVRNCSHTSFFTAPPQLTKMFQSVLCDYTVIVLLIYFFTAPPQLPDAVRKDHSQDMVDRTTVINWQPATVDSASDSVTYSVTSSNLDLIDFDNTTTTATVRLPAFNTDYSFCVYAVNVCGSTSGAPRCATPPVMIEAEGKSIALL